ncbi:MAG: peptidoglycan editing factor PgeF [Pseudomonadota bacterium]
MTNTPNPITAPDLASDKISHGFFTREGGVSTGIYAGLNVGIGSEDDRALVIENRNRVAKHLGAESENFLTAYQIHSPDALVVEKPWEGDRPQLDALVTRTPGIAVGVLTADCGPVLFADNENGVVGAAHAGWKGATGGVLENTIAAMESIGADLSSINAVLGPTISGKNYEVGPEFAERLTIMNPRNETWLSPSNKEDHFMFDLPGYIVERLTAAGVKASWSGHCTYADEESFFSYRRKTHRDEPDYGRQVAAIKIDDHY